MAPLSWLCVVVGVSMLSPLPFREAERGGQSHCFAIAIIITSTRCRVHHSNELFIATFFANFVECPKGEVRRILIPRPSERVGGACSVALRTTETMLLDPFWAPFTSQIHGQRVAHTPFRTVS